MERIHRSASVALFSAHAEVFARNPRGKQPLRCLLRSGGCIWKPRNFAHASSSSSPLTRRYLAYRRWSIEEGGVFSAHAEVFAPSAAVATPDTGLIRLGGGNCAAHSGGDDALESSPLTRRYLRRRHHRRCAARVFSACAEVIAKQGQSKSFESRLSAQADVIAL